MSVVKLAEAKAHLGKLLDRVEAGDSIDITRRGRAVARLTAVAKPRKPVDAALLRALTAGMPLQSKALPISFGQCATAIAIRAS